MSKIARKRYLRKKDEQILLRMPEGMRKRLEDRTNITRRSVSTEIVMAIEAHLNKPTILERLDRIEKYLGLRDVYDA